MLRGTIRNFNLSRKPGKRESTNDSFPEETGATQKGEVHFRQREEQAQRPKCKMSKKQKRFCIAYVEHEEGVSLGVLTDVFFDKYRMQLSRKPITTKARKSYAFLYRNQSNLSYKRSFFGEMKKLLEHKIYKNRQY